MIALGIDPGLANPGAAIVRRYGAVGFALVECPILDDADALYAWLSNKLDDGFPVVANEDVAGFSVVATEDVAWSAHAKVERGPGSVRILETVGAARLFAIMLGLTPDVMHAATWKKLVTGSGKATKEQVREVIRRRVRDVPKVLGLNRSDAIAIAVAGLIRKRSGVR